MVLYEEWIKIYYFSYNIINKELSLKVRIGSTHKFVEEFAPVFL